MNRAYLFVQATKWQLRLLFKYNILTIALAVAIIYASLLAALPVLKINDVIIPLLLSDPTMLGFIFIGVIVLFEKSENTLQALQVTPMSADLYLWSKALALLVPAIVCTIGIAIAAYGLNVNYALLLITIGLASLIFTFLGIVGVSKVSSFNQYILIIPLFLTPTVLPFLNFYGFTNTNWWYLIPIQSILDLLEISTGRISFWMVTIHIAYLTIWVHISFLLAKRSYQKNICS